MASEATILVRAGALRCSLIARAVPTTLRGYAGLNRECSVVGANTRVEIWDATAWADYLAGAEESFSSLSEDVMPGVL